MHGPRRQDLGDAHSPHRQDPSEACSPHGMLFVPTGGTPGMLLVPVDTRLDSTGGVREVRGTGVKEVWLRLQNKAGGAWRVFSVSLGS